MSLVSNHLSRALISFMAHSLARTLIRLREEILLVKSWVILCWLLFEQWSIKLRGLLVIVLTNLAKEIMGLHMQQFYWFDKQRQPFAPAYNHILSLFSKSVGMLNGLETSPSSTLFSLSFKVRSRAKSKIKSSFFSVLTLQFHGFRSRVLQHLDRRETTNACINEVDSQRQW